MTALRPNSINIPSLDMNEIDSKVGPTKEEQLLYGMSKSEGWRIFTELAKRVCDELNQVNVAAIEAGASFEEIGKNTLVISATQGIIDRLLNKVQDAQEVCTDGKTK